MRFTSFKCLSVFVGLFAYSAIAIIDLGGGVYTDKANAPSGAPFYLAIERVDENNRKLWEAYAWATENLYDAFELEQMLADDLTKGKNKIGSQLKKSLLEKPKFRALSAVKDGSSKFREMLAKNHQTYIVYASKQEIQGRFEFSAKFREWQKKYEPKPGVRIPAVKLGMKDFEDGFANVLMTMTLTNWEKTPLVEHLGIFRNMLDFKDPQKTYSGISMRFHGFAGAFTEQFLKEKQYMKVSPTGPMSEILRKNVPKGQMFIGVVKASGVGKVEFPEFPPIIFEEGDGTRHLAKEGIDLSKEKAPLSLAAIWFTESVESKKTQTGLYFAMGGSQIHLIKLDALAHFFKP